MAYVQSRHRSTFLGLKSRVFLLISVLEGMALLFDPSVAADKDQMVSRVIAKEMTAAQKALQTGQWQETLDNLDAAEKKSPLTPFDLKTIYDFRAFADIKLNRLPQAQMAYEQALGTGQYNAAEEAKTRHLLFQIAAASQQYSTAVKYGEQAAQSGEDFLTMAQTYYLQKNCKDSVRWADKAIEYAQRANVAPKEVLFQFKLQCASDAGDNAGMRTALIELIRLTNKPSYWNPLLRIERQEEKSDHDLLMIYRLMYDTNSLSAGSDYLEMAQLLSDAALPGEARQVIERGMAQGTLNDSKTKERATRLLEAVKTRANSDKQAAPQLDTEATRSSAGEPQVKLGEVYFGSGDYQSAVTAIGAGLRKGQIKHLDEAYVYLGRAQLAINNDTDAKNSFAALKTVSGVSPRISRLWALYAEQLPSRGAAPVLNTTASVLPKVVPSSAPAARATDIPPSVSSSSAPAPSKQVLRAADDDSWVPVHRFALVIGNSRYGLLDANPTAASRAWPDLEGGPLADAKAMEALLRTLNFEVITITDANLDRMNDALGKFSNRVASESDALALFYFSGHGTHAPRGPGEDGEDTYLVPVSSNLSREQEAHYKALSLSQVTAVLRAARAGIVILDACRNNALERASTRGAEERGLGRVTAVSGMLFAYSTAAGDVAENRPGQMSRYTELLVTQLGQPGESVEKSFRIVRKRLSVEGKHAHLPELTVQLNDDIFLR